MSTAIREESIPRWTAADRYRKAREHAGFDQGEFAERIGVSRQTVTNAEKGHRSVRRITTLAWAMATGVPAHWLETGSVETPTTPGTRSVRARRDSNSQPSDP